MFFQFNCQAVTGNLVFINVCVDWIRQRIAIEALPDFICEEFYM